MKLQSKKNLISGFQVGFEKETEKKGGYLNEIYWKIRSLSFFDVEEQEVRMLEMVCGTLCRKANGRVPPFATYEYEEGGRIVS